LSAIAASSASLGESDVFEDPRERLHNLQLAVGQRSQTVQEQMARVGKLQREVVAEDKSLMKDAERVQLLQRANAKRLALLERAGQRLAAHQQRLLEDQQAILQLQQVLNALANPMLASMVPGFDVGLVANPDLVDRLPSEIAPHQRELLPGRYRLTGTLTAKEDKESKSIAGPQIRLTLHKDGTISGVSRYDDSFDIPIIGRWRERSVAYVELLHGRLYDFKGSFSPLDSSLSGHYFFKTEDGKKKEGRFNFKVFSARTLLPQGKGYVPPNYFRDLPGRESHFEEVPMQGPFVPGFYKAHGSTVNLKTGAHARAPPMFFLFKADGSLVGQATYPAAGTLPLTETRLAGYWNATHFEYTEMYNDEAFVFTGFLVPGTPEAEGTYKYGESGQGTFKYAFVRVVSHEPDFSKGLAAPADEPLRAAPKGQVYNAVAGAGEPLEGEALARAQAAMEKSESSAPGKAAAAHRKGRAPLPPRKVHELLRKADRAEREIDERLALDEELPETPELRLEKRLLREERQLLEEEKATGIATPSTKDLLDVHERNMRDPGMAPFLDEKRFAIPVLPHCIERPCKKHTYVEAVDVTDPESKYETSFVRY
jgi:hypothetical protein